MLVFLPLFHINIESILPNLIFINQPFFFVFVN